MLDVINVNTRIDNFFKKRSHKRNFTMILQELGKLSLKYYQSPSGIPGGDLEPKRTEEDQKSLNRGRNTGWS